MSFVDFARNAGERKPARDAYGAWHVGGYCICQRSLDPSCFAQGNTAMSFA
jgi:hypothetical protein